MKNKLTYNRAKCPFDESYNLFESSIKRFWISLKDNSKYYTNKEILEDYVELLVHILEFED